MTPRDYSNLRTKAQAARDSGPGLTHEYLAFTDDATPDAVLALLDEIDVARAKAPKMKKEEYPPDFIDAMGAMKRVGLAWRAGTTMPAAYAKWKARIVAGASPIEMHAGADKYARYCKATGSEIKAAQVFFGPGEYFTADWTIPARPGMSRPGKFDPVAHINQGSTSSGEWDGIIDINPCGRP